MQIHINILFTLGILWLIKDVTKLQAELKEYRTSVAMKQAEEIMDNMKSVRLYDETPNLAMLPIDPALKAKRDEQDERMWRLGMEIEAERQAAELKRKADEAEYIITEVVKRLNAKVEDKC